MNNNSSLPVHVAFIMDGNGRWADRHGLPRLEGYRVGVEKIRPLLKYLKQSGINYVSLYAFSTENWNRPKDEVKGIFSILESIIDKESRELHKNGVRICHFGCSERLTPSLQEAIKKAVELTANNKNMTLGVALDYGGRAEILNAVQRIIRDGIPPENIDEPIFERYLYTAGFPDVDLLIRTSGEIRTSNFLIWQAAYSEYYFTPVLWPDFDEKELEKALQAYSQRNRRFGGR